MGEVKERCFMCVDCGDEFWSIGVFANRCPICRQRYKREQQAQRSRERWQSQYRKRRKEKRGYVMSVEEFMHNCDEYNRVHGTRLNYGTYDRLLRRERGELAVEVKL